MYTLLNLRPLLSQGNGNLKASLFGLAELDLRPAGPNTLMLTQRLGTVEQKMLARYFEESGRKKISSLYGDMIEADAGIWALAIAFLLFGIAVLWSTAVLMISLIRFILRKIRKRERRKGFFHKYHIILCAAALVLMVNILLVGGIMIPGEGSAGVLVPHIAASIVLGILPVAYAVLLAAKWRKLACGKMQKAVYLITLCIGFVMTLNVLVLELYRL